MFYCGICTEIDFPKENIEDFQAEAKRIHERVLNPDLIGAFSPEDRQRLLDMKKTVSGWGRWGRYYREDFEYLKLAEEIVEITLWR